MTIDIIFHPTHQLQCIITGLSNSGKSVFLTDLSLDIIDEYSKIYISSHLVFIKIYIKN